MVKKIIWTPLAQEKRKQILKFWIEHNKSNTYSIKLNQLFKEAVKLIAKHPNIGRPTDVANVRVKIVRDYLLFYEHTNTAIYILTVWDSRQDSNELKIK